MKNKWLSILSTVVGIALLTGCKTDNIEERFFFPAPQISFIIEDETILTDSLSLNPIYQQPEITIKVHSAQGVNEVTLTTYRNNGNLNTTDDLEIIDEERRTFTLNTENIIFTIPAGSIAIDDNTYVYQIDTKANYGAIRTVRKPVKWHHGERPQISLAGPPNLPDNFGSQPITISGIILSEMGLEQVRVGLVDGAFDDSDLSKIYPPFANLPDITFTEKEKFNKSFSIEIPANAQSSAATGILIAAYDLLGQTTNRFIFLTPKAAPAFKDFPDELPADFDTDEYTLEGAVSSVEGAGLKNIKVEILAGSFSGPGQPNVTNSILITEYASFSNPLGQGISLTLPATQTAGMFGIRITATDRFGQESVKSLFVPFNPPFVEIYSAFLPSTLASAGYTALQGIATSRAGLVSVVVDILTGSFSGNTVNVTGFVTAETVTTFVNPNEYEFSFNLNPTAGAVGVKVTVSDGSLSENTTVYAIAPASVVFTKYTGLEVRGWRNRNSQVFVYSLTYQTGCTLDDTGTASKPSDIISGSTYTYGQMADFSFISKQGDLTQAEKYELWTPASASLGGYMTASLPEWSVKNSTWFGLIGKVRSAENPKGIVWNDLAGYNEIVSLIDIPNAPGATNWPAAFRYTDGVNIGDIYAFKTDPDKLYGGGKIGVLLVTGFRYAATPPERYDDTRLQFEIIIQSPN